MRSWHSLTTSPSVCQSVRSSVLRTANYRNDNRETKKKWEQMCDNADKTVSEQTGPPPPPPPPSPNEQRRDPESVSQLGLLPNYELGTVVNRQRVLSSPGIPRKDGYSSWDGKLGGRNEYPKRTFTQRPMSFMVHSYGRQVTIIATRDLEDTPLNLLHITHR